LTEGKREEERESKKKRHSTIANTNTEKERGEGKKAMEEKDCMPKHRNTENQTKEQQSVHHLPTSRSKQFVFLCLSF
jgi:hypothetical protein